MTHLRLKSLSNQKGMSVLGALAGASAMLVVGLAVSQMMRTQADMVFYLEDRLSALNLKGDVQLALSNENACIRSLNRAGFDSIARARDDERLAIVNSAGEPIYTRGEKYDAIQIRDVTVKADAAIPAGGSGIVEFTVYPQRTRGSLSQSLSPFTIRRAVTVNGATAVVECTAVNTGDGGEEEEDENSRNDCLKLAGGPPGHPGGNLFEAVPNYTRRVPASVKAFSMTLGPITGNVNPVPGSDNASGRILSIPPAQLTIHFGKTRLGGKVLEAGKVLEHRNGEWFYDDVRIAKKGHIDMISDRAEPHDVPRTLQMSQLGATCPNPSDDSGNGFGTYWD